VLPATVVKDYHWAMDRIPQDLADDVAKFFIDVRDVLALRLVSSTFHAAAWHCVLGRAPSLEAVRGNTQPTSEVTEMCVWTCPPSASALLPAGQYRRLYVVCALQNRTAFALSAKDLPLPAFLSVLPTTRLAMEACTSKAVSDVVRRMPMLAGLTLTTCEARPQNVQKVKPKTAGKRAVESELPILCGLQQFSGTQTISMVPHTPIVLFCRTFAARRKHPAEAWRSLTRLRLSMFCDTMAEPLASVVASLCSIDVTHPPLVSLGIEVLGNDIASSRVPFDAGIICRHYPQLRDLTLRGVELIVPSSATIPDAPTVRTITDAGRILAVCFPNVQTWCLEPRQLSRSADTWVGGTPNLFDTAVEAQSCSVTVADADLFPGLIESAAARGVPTIQASIVTDDAVVVPASAIARALAVCDEAMISLGATLTGQIDLAACRVQFVSLTVNAMDQHAECTLLQDLLQYAVNLQSLCLCSLPEGRYHGYEATSTAYTLQHSTLTTVTLVIGTRVIVDLGALPRLATLELRYALPTHVRFLLAQKSSEHPSRIRRLSLENVQVDGAFGLDVFRGLALPFLDEINLMWCSWLTLLPEYFDYTSEHTPSTESKMRLTQLSVAGSTMCVTSAVTTLLAMLPSPQALESLSLIAASEEYDERAAPPSLVLPRINELVGRFSALRSFDAFGIQPFASDDVDAALEFLRRLPYQALHVLHLHAADVCVNKHFVWEACRFEDVSLHVRLIRTARSPRRSLSLDHQRVRVKRFELETKDVLGLEFIPSLLAAVAGTLTDFRVRFVEGHDNDQLLALLHAVAKRLPSGSLRHLSGRVHIGIDLSQHRITSHLFDS
jgi:hypothetical protein